MEQYLMPSDPDFNDLRFCLDNYLAEYIFIRDCGGYRENGRYDPEGKMKVGLELQGRLLNFNKDQNGLHILVDSDEVFNFPLKDCGTIPEVGFTLAYERVESSGRMVMLTHGSDPYDPNLPEPRSSILRDIIDKHLMEISFKGRINIRFHSWYKKPHWKLWAIEKPESISSNE